MHEQSTCKKIVIPNVFVKRSSFFYESVLLSDVMKAYNVVVLISSITLEFAVHNKFDFWCRFFKG